MNDMSVVIVPKSDQINADDLIAGPMTITVKEVRIKAGEDQPVDIYFEGSKKAYRPCKSMSRVLVHVWGPDAGKYLDKSLTLYRDPNVRFGKDAVGGIRISHMTDIPAEKLDDGRVIMQLTATRAQRKPHVVRPLVLVDQQNKPASNTRPTAAQFTRDHIAAVQDAETIEALEQILAEDADMLGRLKTSKPDLFTEADNAATVRRAQLEQPGKGVEDSGEGFSDDAPPIWQARVDAIASLIDNAIGDASLEAANAELMKHGDALPDDVYQRLSDSLEAKRRELAEASRG